MDKQECFCGEKNSALTCSVCDRGAPLLYWCETCQRQVPEKRCPGCGLKARKVRRKDQS